MTTYSEQDLRHLQSKVRHLSEAFDLISDHIIITDREGVIIYANKGAEMKTGFSTEEMIGKRPGDLWGGQMEESFYVNMWIEIKEKKVPFFGEVKNKRKDGTFYWQETRIYPVLGDDGEIEFFIGIEPDITTRKTFESVHGQYVEEMERLLKSMEGRKVKIRELTEEVQKLKQKLDASESKK